MANQDKLRVVIDTNWWVSATINSVSRKKIYRILSSHHIQLLYSRKLFNEYFEVIKREKFRKLVLFSKAERFISLVLPMMIEIADSNNISEVRDVKDVFIVAAIRNDRVDYLITGDNDLLTMKKIGETRVVHMDWFLHYLDKISV